MDSQLLSSLEQRVSQLERDLGLPLGKQDPSLTESLSKLERDIDALGLNHLNPALVEKYTKLQGLLDCRDTRQLLSRTMRKAELLVKSEEEIRQVASQLEEVQRLKRFLDFDPLHSKGYVDVKEKLTDLRPLEVKAQSLLTSTTIVQDKTLELVADYNSVVAEISDLFLQLANTRQS